MLLNAIDKKIKQTKGGLRTFVPPADLEMILQYTFGKLFAIRELVYTMQPRLLGYKIDIIDNCVFICKLYRLKKMCLHHQPPLIADLISEIFILNLHTVTLECAV